MIMTRSTAVTAAVCAAAALAATGITYATAAPAPAPQAAPAAPAVVQQAPAQAPMGGESGQGKGNEGGGRGGRGGEGGERGEGGQGGEHGKRRHHEIGRIFINERSFSAQPDGCITVVSGLGSKSFNIRNDSKRAVEFFRGATCDNGAPVATVGPHSEANGVKVHHTKGIHVKDGVVGSFRVVKRHHGEDFDFDFDDF
ncbi:hypothetical protein [Streptomyces sp. 6-11-2]|uniref:hypothetical protein n=1 Tax=Streptomyces sp. 6-11-2 TaxID=2585753 RepID=UPI00116D2F2A|nr:hypothetical protein [Streptomyces sp. 6-11-2]GED89717.1 hypothetical protein TNCT6_68020 [Streptomyces sp. 6-11-2]